MAESTIAMARARRALPSADYLSIRTRLTMEWSRSKLANCPRRYPAWRRRESGGDASDRANWRMVRPTPADRGAGPCDGRTSGAAQHGELVVCVRERGADGVS